MFEIFEGQRAPSLQDTIKVAGTPFDLSTSTVTFSMRLPWESTLTIDHQPAVVVNGPAGSVRYDWGSGDTATAGDFLYWWTVTPSGGFAQDTPEGRLSVLAHTPSNDLITVDDVLTGSQIPAALQPDPSALIQFYITLASNRVMSEYGHIRPYEVNVTKRLVVRKTRVRTFPYFLVRATDVLLHPESFMRTLDPTIPDYFLTPQVTLEGCYTQLRISPWIPIVSPTSMRFGYALCDITGDWGYQIVPDAVRLGVLVAVRSWMLRDAAAYGDVVQMQDPSVLPRPAGTYALPMAAREHLSLFAQTAHVA